MPTTAKVIHLPRFPEKREFRPSQPGGGAYFDRVVASILKCKDRELAALTLDKAAALVGVHPGIIEGQFRTRMKMTFAAYVEREKIYRVARLLEDREENLVPGLIRELGFASPHAFCAAFKRYYTVPPGRYSLLVKVRDMPVKEKDELLKRDDPRLCARCFHE